MGFFTEMPRSYERTSNRGSWTQELLQAAFKAIKEDGMTIYTASKTFNIPERTLRRRILTNNDKKEGLGPKGNLGSDIEKKIALHIKRLQAAAFCPTVTEVRILAFKMAERYKLKHKFNTEKEMAGYDWFYKFLKRNPDISVRKSEGLSLSRAQGLTREDADAYFNLLKSTLEENCLMQKPSNIYNVDETGLQLNNKPGLVLAEKGSKDVHKLTSGEKGENITAIVCCNAEGNFLPPVCIFKGVNKKAEWEDKMPPGSHIVMSKKSSYINTDIFTDWIEHHFIPRKALGKCLLILDGHTSHTSADRLLDLAAENDIILLCLPSHSTHFLQPLDRCFFKSLKHFWNLACQRWMSNHSAPNNPRKLGRAQFGELLSYAWTESATSRNGIVSFEATGIFPYNPEAIPSRAFVGSNEDPELHTNFFKQRSCSSKSSSKKSYTCQTLDIHQPSTSRQLLIQPESLQATENDQRSSNPDLHTTPTKVLNELSPIPVYAKRTINKRRQDAQVLTSPEVIADKKAKREKKEERLGKKNKLPNYRNKKNKEGNRPGNKNKSRETIIPPLKRLFNSKKANTMKDQSSSDNDMNEEEIPYQESDNEDLKEMFMNKEECAECLEDYNTTLDNSDWIKCIVCNHWLHESCSKFPNKCAVCGRAEILLKRKQEHCKIPKK